MPDETRFTLKLTDFGVLATLAFTAVAGTSCYLDKSLEVVSAELKGNIDTHRAETGTRFDSLASDIQRASTDLSSLVSSALSARTNEVVLALTQFSDQPVGLVLSVSNIGRNSDAFTAMNEIINNYGRSVRSFEVLGKVHYEITVDDISDSAALALQEAFSLAPADQWADVSVKISPVDPINLDQKTLELLVRQNEENVLRALEVIRSNGLQ